MSDEPESGEHRWPWFGQAHLEAVSRVLRSGRVNYRGGVEGPAFEQEFSARMDVRHALALSNGTVALELALRACKAGAGDEVIVPARGFVACASAAVMCGARPVFADVDPVTGNLRAEDVAPLLGPRTRAVLCVHIGGWPCEMAALSALCEANNVALIEDCAQAHGACFEGRPVGGHGDLGAFSFCQDKIITTGGEGGMLSTNDDALAQTLLALRDHGKSPALLAAPAEAGKASTYRWLHTSAGTNARLTELQSALGRVGLAELDARLAVRQQYAQTLRDTLREQPGVLVPRLDQARMQPAWYRTYIALDPRALRPGYHRDRLLLALARQGIDAGSGVCPELYREQAFAACAPERPCVNAHHLGQNSVMFDLHHRRAAGYAERVGEVVSDWLRRAQR